MRAGRRIKFYAKKAILKLLLPKILFWFFFALDLIRLHNQPLPGRSAWPAGHESQSLHARRAIHIFDLFGSGGFFVRYTINIFFVFEKYINLILFFELGKEIENGIVPIRLENILAGMREDENIPRFTRKGAAGRVRDSPRQGPLIHGGILSVNIGDDLRVGFDLGDHDAELFVRRNKDISLINGDIARFFLRDHRFWHFGAQRVAYFGQKHAAKCQSKQNRGRRHHDGARDQQ